MAAIETYYLEYEIIRNRVGLLGDVTCLMGMLGLNILSVNGVSGNWRGFLLQGDSLKLEALREALQHIDNISVTALRYPSLQDVIAMRHGQRLAPIKSKPATYCFVREQLGLLIDFLGEILKTGGNTVIGFRGMPQVGKTEASIAGCVYAKKRWVLVSSTMIRQNLRHHLEPEEVSGQCVLIIDGITSVSRGDKEHLQLIKEVLAAPIPKIIEHPDILIRDGGIDSKIFDYMIELRHQPEDEIPTEMIPTSISAFDIS